MQTRQFGGKDGLDFGIVEADGDMLVMHGGGIPGYSSKFILATKARVGVCIAANAGDVRLSNDITACLAIDLLRGREVGAGLIQKVVHVGINFYEDKETGLLRIGNVFPNSSASKAGLSIGTLIRKIGDTDVKGKPLKECLQLMEGPEGTTLTFEFFDPKTDTANTVQLKKQVFLAPV